MYKTKLITYSLLLVLFGFLPYATEQFLNVEARNNNDSTDTVSPQRLNSNKTQVINKDINFEGNKLSNDVPVIKPSNIIEDLKRKKEQNPQISPQELADYGNELAKTKGYNYIFENCKINDKDKTTNEMPDDNKLEPFDYQVTNLKGSKVTFRFMANDFRHPCFCIVDIPTLKVNKQVMIVIANGKPVELAHTEDFYLEEFVLVDKTLKKEVRKWLTPIDAVPLGISDDGTKVYFEYTPEDLQELVYELSEDGTIKFAAKADNKINKGKGLKGYPKHSEISYRIFNAKGREYIVKFSYPCT